MCLLESRSKIFINELFTKGAASDAVPVTASKGKSLEDVEKSGSTLEVLVGIPTTGFPEISCSVDKSYEMSDKDCEGVTNEY